MEDSKIAHRYLPNLARRRLRGALPLAFAFWAGTVVGAVAFAMAGYLVLAVPVIAVGGLALWATRCSDTTRESDQR
jgi:hypothetical protein